MEPSRIRTLLDAQPFVPFAVTTTRIGTISIPSARLALLTRSTLFVGQNVDADGLPERAAAVALAQITGIVAGG
ncbi:MAG: hypothetical protein JWO31_3686 [Phycisphaerales bacterium]|nr:hypothetical protein [Phycisphaerales bacterium]